MPTRARSPQPSPDDHESEPVQPDPDAHLAGTRVINKLTGETWVIGERDVAAGDARREERATAEDHEIQVRAWRIQQKAVRFWRRGRGRNDQKD